MKATLALSLRPSLNGAKRIPLGLVVAAIFLHPSTTAQITPIEYGTASSFSILAGTGITVAAPHGMTTITGDIGSFPTASITGLENVVFTTGPSQNQAGDALTQTAKGDFWSAYGVAAGEIVSPTGTLSATDNQLGGQTLVPGVYRFGHGDTANLSGTLTLDANGEANPVWIFQATSDLVTASGSSVVFLNSGVPCDVVWQVGSSATLATDTHFLGTIMANTSIVLDAGATLTGRAWAYTGDVTLDHNTITGLPCTSIGDTGDTTHPAGVPDGGSTLLLLATGLATLVGLGRWFRSLVF